jgi:hypothetical protein
MKMELCGQLLWKGYGEFPRTAARLFTACYFGCLQDYFYYAATGFRLREEWRG